MLEQSYKFYLSFENAACEDYATEKLWKVLHYSIIPVVLGGANYSEILPKKSYINVRDFESVEKLAEYLKYLDKNETAYAEYFEWKRYFTVSTNFADVFCELCQSLHKDTTTKVYQNLTKWWQTDAKCQNKGSFPWSHLQSAKSRCKGLNCFHILIFCFLLLVTVCLLVACIFRLFNISKFLHPKV